MTNDRSASSSDDLERARRTSQRLAGLAPPAAAGRVAAPYIRFSAAGIVPEPQLATPFGPAVWNEMLDKCVADAGAELAFVIDMQGLVVASRGDMDASLVEGIGARLLIAFEQTDQMGELGADTQSMAIEIGRRWLTGFRVRRGERTFTVGVLGPAVVAHTTRATLAAILAQ